MQWNLANQERARITSAGRLLLGTTTESTFLLDVNGTARVQGNTTITTALGIGTTYSNSFFPKLLIGGNSTGGINVFSVIASNTIQSDVTGNYQTFRSAPSTQATAFTLTNLIHYNLIDISKGAGSTITNQYGLFVNDLVSATNNFGIYSNISSGTNKYNLYINGTATNYFNSNIGINTTLPTFPLTRKGLVIRGTSDGAEINLQSTNATDGTTSGFALIASGNDGFILNRLSGNLSLGTNNNLNQLTIASNGTLTSVANATASGAIARGVNITPTLVAAANNDVLVGLDINPSFNTGAFTNVGFYALRVNGVVSLYDSAGATQIRIIGPSGSNKSLFFGNSSAFSAFQNVRLYNQATTNLFVIATGDGTANPTDRFFITQGGNVGINTSGTDAGFKLDVNGTARVQDLVHLSNASGGQIRMWTSTANNSGIYGINSSSTGIYGNAHVQFDLFIRSTGSGTKKFGQSSLGNTNNICITNNNTSLEPIMITTTDSGAVGIMKSTSTIPASAVFEIESTTKGFLPPRGTNAQRNAISSPAVGLIFYCTDATEGLYIYTSSGWKSLTMT